MLAGNRENSMLYLTIFIRWGVESLYMTLLVKQGGLKVSARFPVRRRVGIPAPSLGESFCISLIEVPMLSTSPRLIPLAKPCSSGPNPVDGRLANRRQADLQASRSIRQPSSG
jgi:hypothetical protein